MENSFKEFDRVLETGDKQAVPIRQQDALGYVGQIEEAMVKEFPYQVPSEYDYLPQLKVSVMCCLFMRRVAAMGPCVCCFLSLRSREATERKHLLLFFPWTTTYQVTGNASQQTCSNSHCLMSFCSAQGGVAPGHSGCMLHL